MEQLGAIETAPRSILLEPAARNTAPAISAAAFEIQTYAPKGVMLVLPSDHAMADHRLFQQAVMVATEAAISGKIVTFGIAPYRPETGYGYLELPLGSNPFEDRPQPLAGFVEKPEVGRAIEMLEAGISPSKHFLQHGADEGRLPINLRAHYPECFDPLEQAIDIATLFQMSKPLFPEDIPAILKETARALVAQEHPKISVIIPTWNRAYSILPAVHSALAQTLKPYEIIVVDDGSTDGTVDLLNWKFSEAIQSGILHVIKQDHCGVSFTRNTGLEACQGDLIAYLDSDNIWHTDHLLYLAAGLFHQKGAQICYGGYHRHDLDRQYSQIEHAPFEREALKTENFIDLNTVLHTRDLYQKCGGFDTNMTRLVDWDFLLRLTQDHNPVHSPVISVDYFISQKRLMNISTVESLEENIAVLRSKLNGEATTSEVGVILPTSHP